MIRHQYLSLSESVFSTLLALLLVIGPSYVFVCSFVKVWMSSSTVLSSEAISLGSFFPDFVVCHNSHFPMQEETANSNEEF